MNEPTLQPTRRELRNLGWRAFWTAVEAFAGVLMAGFTGAGTGWIDVDAQTVLIISGFGAAIGGVLAVIKNFASVRLGKQEV